MHNSGAMATIDVPQIADAFLAALVRTEVESRWPAGVSGLDEIVRHGLMPFGKLMGPWLLFQSSLAVGGEISPVLPAAVAVECVQVGAMMHDDFIDSDTERRGQEAAWSRFGAPAAVVGGNGLFFHGFAALARCRQTGVPDDRISRGLALLADAGLRIGDAALREIRMGRGRCSIDAYLRMIEDKSGALLWMACGLGAVLSGADEQSMRALRTYSDQLGVGYQIRDDLMAYDGTRAGKPNISDLRNGRPTLPVLVAHRRAPASEQLRIEQLLADELLPVQERYEEMATIVRKYDGVVQARTISHRYARLAAEALDGLPPGEHRDALADLTVPGRLV